MAIATDMRGREPARISRRGEARGVITRDGVQRRVQASAGVRQVGHDVKRELAAQGWSVCGGEAFVVSAPAAYDELRREFRALPLDPYARTKNRRRRHARLVYLPWVDVFVERPGSEYYQRPEHNPIDGGIVRAFAAIRADTLRNHFLLDLIRLDLTSTPLREAAPTSPIEVGLHMIAYEPTPGAPAIATPNQFHRDGEPYTFIHLIHREDVEGGENLVARDDGRLLAEFTLTRELDCFAVRDCAVVHAVKEIRVAPGRPRGFRSILIVDFTPLEASARTTW